MPQIHEGLYTGRHGDVFSGLWHVRMVRAWHHAWASDLLGEVNPHGDGLYTVPSQRERDVYYAVQRYPLAPDGYLWVCDCKASEAGGFVCAHSMAAYLWSLERQMGFRLLRPF